MDQPLWMEFNALVKRGKWPEDGAMLETSRRQYLLGLELVNSFHGDPDPLFKALEKFKACGSGAYAKAGIAAVLISASYDSGDSYEEDGLKAAASYLTQARRVLANRPEIDHLAALLCILLKRREQARQILDKLQKAYPNSYYVASIEVWYWYDVGDLEKAEASFQIGKEFAKTKVQSLRLASQRAGCYLRHANPHDAIEPLRMVTEMDPDDPWGWHNLSIGLFRAGKLRQAKRCNAEALALMEFEAARQVEKTLREFSRSPLLWLVYKYRTWKRLV